MPLRWKLMLSIGLPLILIYTAVLAWTYVRLRTRGYEQMRVHTRQLAEHYADELGGNLSTLAQVASSAAVTVTLRTDQTEEQLYQLLEANVRQDPLVYGSCIAFAPGAFDPQRSLFAPYAYRDGSEIRRMDVAASAYDYTQPRWEWFRVPESTGEPLWTEPFFDEGAGNVVMSTYTAPFFRDGAFRGVVTIDVHLVDLQNTIRITDFAEGSFAILSRRGTFICHPNPDFILNESIFTLARRLRRPDVEEAARDMTAGGSGTFMLDVLGTDEPEWVFYAPIKSTGWSFVVAVPDTQVMAFANEQLYIGIGMMMLGLLLIAMMLFVMSKRITRPIADLASTVEDLSAGNLDTRVIAVNTRDEIGDLAQSFNQMVRDLRRHVDALKEQTAAREAVESELRIARTIQSSLLPSVFPPFPDQSAFDLHAVNIPARHVGGDFFDFFFIDDRTLVFVIADVSGKGVPAALFMAVARTILRNFAATVRSPAQLMARANELLLRDNVYAMFVTMFLGFYDVQTGRIAYANAGHPRPMLLSNGHVREFGEITGTILGVVDGELYEQREDQLRIGETLLLFTDGVPEARAPDREFYTAARFVNLLRELHARNVRDLCSGVVNAVNEFQHEDPADDLTLLALRRCQ